MQTTPGRYVRCLTSVDAGETFCADFCFVASLTVHPQPLYPLESFSSPSSTTSTLPPLSIDPLPIVPPKSKRLCSSQSASNCSLKRSRSVAVKPAQRGTGAIARVSSLRADIRKTQSPSPAKPTETRTQSRSSLKSATVPETGTTAACTQRKKRRSPERPPLGASTTAAAMPARGSPLQVDSATPTSSTLATAGQSTVLTPDLAASLFARLDRLDTRLDERDDLLLQHIDSRFDQLAPRLKHVEAVQHELATSVQAVRDDHARQIASLSKHLDALSEAGPGWGALEAALDLSTDPAHQDEYESLLSAYNLHIINNEPTHHVIFADGSLRKTCLDLCIVRDPSLVLEHSKSLIPFMAGYDLITMRYNVKRNPPPPTICMVQSWLTVTSHILNRTILHQLNSLHLLPNSMCGPSIGRAVFSLTAAILSAVDDVTPLRPETFSTRHKP
ncbi:hypothetical protein TKK_0000279 [Trichogramma kaykai]